jgi:hypothetical protein
MVNSKSSGGRGEGKMDRAEKKERPTDKKKERQTEKKKTKERKNRKKERKKERKKGCGRGGRERVHA